MYSVPCVLGYIFMVWERKAFKWKITLLCNKFRAIAVS